MQTVGRFNSVYHVNMHFLCAYRNLQTHLLHSGFVIYLYTGLSGYVALIRNLQTSFELVMTRGNISVSLIGTLFTMLHWKVYGLYVVKM